ncbi:MAG: thiamine-binding protein [Rhodoferax sp.]
MLVAFSVWPSGGSGGDSVHDAVAAAVRIVRASGLPNRTDSMFTTIEGEWDEVFDVIHRAADAVSAYGKRVDLVIKADIRLGHDHELTRKVESLEKAITDQDKASGST